ncbi:MAG: DUF3572 domain-containing protein [Hyphomicrobiaceae bacterium]
MARRGKGAMTEEAAEGIGARALLFLAEDERRLVRFLGETGLDPETLRERMGTPELLASVLGHLLGDESQLLVFATSVGLDPTEISKAHQTLSVEH